MNEWINDVYSRLSERYASGEIPWDDSSPPPEVLEFVPSLMPGRAIDLGCGYGRASIYLAEQGWEVDGIDFVEQALAEARRRSSEAGVSVQFHRSSVTEIDFLEGPYQFALDVGCAHALDDQGLRQYKDQLFRLLEPGATFMLFARCGEEQDDESSGPPGLDERVLLEIFEDGFRLTWVEHSETDMDDGASWPSAWYRFKRI